MRRTFAPVATFILLVLAAGCAADEPSGEPAEASTSDIPPGTDIWIARLQRDGAGTLSLTEPDNATHRPGYDNQPAFLPDGSGLYYTVIDEAEQADIWYHRLSDGTSSRVTDTAPESEYSPTPLPTGDGFSVIRVESDSTQRLWRFDTDGGAPSVLLGDVAPVGYHAWVDLDLVVLYVLGDPATLQVAHLSTQTATVVATDVGRSIQAIPGTRAVSYVQRLPGGATEIRRLDPDAGVTERIVDGVEGGDFHAWTPDGVLLQGHGGRLLAFRPGTDADWREVADLTSLGLRLSRLAVHPDGTWIALVAEGPDGS